MWEFPKASCSQSFIFSSGNRRKDYRKKGIRHAGVHRSIYGSERMCVLTSLVNMIVWCNSIVQHRKVHGSFREPLQNADATDVSILQMMHVKRVPTWALQNSANALHGKRGLWIPVCPKINKLSAKPSTKQRFDMSQKDPEENAKQAIPQAKLHERIQS